MFTLKSCIRFAPLLVLLILAALHSPPPTTHATPAPLGEFVPAACVLPLPEDVDNGVGVRCGYVLAPENHDTPDTATIRLPVVILPALSATPAPDPLFMAQGGPGGSTLDYFVYALAGTQLGDQLRAERDVVLVEQRGTLYADPFLGCTELDALVYDTLNTVLSRAEFRALQFDALKACQQRLTSAGVDLSSYNSLQNVNDMHLVRAALGYEQINFYGVSYGTMLVQHYMRAYPQTLRTAIIDAVVPLQTNFLTEYPANAQRVFDVLFAACRADADCNATYPTLEQDFYATAARLNAEPAPVVLLDADNATLYDDLFTGDDWLQLVFRMMYSTELIPLMPQLIDIMYREVPGYLDILGELHSFYQFRFTTARGMYYSTLCAEDADFTAADINNATVRAEVARVFTVDRFMTVCPMWAVETLGAGLDAPVQSDIPTLVLSGEFDPITPPSNGKTAAATLANAYVYTFPGVGHGAFDVPCGTAIMAQFLSQPATSPDASCLTEMGVAFALPR
jgi:pimeloyl-ACP methyl ester carboxylesterase